MRRHLSMEELAKDVLTSARSAVMEKNANAVSRVEPMQTQLGELLAKTAHELRNVQEDDLTYADIVKVAEVRLGYR